MSEEKILAAYEKLAFPYDQKIDDKPHNAHYDRPNTLKLIGNVEGKNILDAACGPGKYAEILHKQGGQVTGFDLSPNMIKLAIQRNKDKGRFFVHSLNEPLISLEDQTFDIVVCALAMHYIKDWTLPLQEFNRVLKPKGQLVLSVEHPFFEYTYFHSKKYFEVEAVKAVWKGFGSPVEVNSYRRPLQECINPLLENGFTLKRLVEPLPTLAFKNLDPRHYRELNQFPAFMHIKAQKN